MGEKREANWDLISFVVSGSLRLKVLIALSKNVLTPSQLKELTGAQISRISSTLRELRDKNMVECLTPEKRKGRLYTITPLGKQVIEKIHELTEV